MALGGSFEASRHLLSTKHHYRKLPDGESTSVMTCPIRQTEMPLRTLHRSSNHTASRLNALLEIRRQPQFLVQQRFSAGEGRGR